MMFKKGLFDFWVISSVLTLLALAPGFLVCTPQVTREPESIKSKDPEHAKRVAEAIASEAAEEKAKAAAKEAKKKADSAPKEKIDLLSDGNILKPVNDPFSGTSKKIKMLNGKMGVPFDLGKGLNFTLGKDNKGTFTSKTGKEKQTVVLDLGLGLYFGGGVCLREDTTPGFCERDGSMKIYYRRVDRSDADKEYCKKALRYETRVPHFGKLIDPTLLNQCQMGKTDCLDSLPPEQFDCKTGKDCSITIADGLCCTVWEPVAYNVTFSKQLREFREKHCTEVSCKPMVDSVGWNDYRCLQNKCVLNPNSRDDDLGALCL